MVEIRDGKKVLITPVSADDLKDIHIGDTLYFYKVIQCGIASEAPAPPHPFSIGYLQAVMFSGTVGISFKLHQLCWLILLQVC